MEHLRNHDRLEQIAHYVIARTPIAQLGATKLNKVLWFADRIAYHRTGQSLTGLEYYTRKDHGPMPPKINERLKNLAKDGRIVERSVETPVGARREFISLQEPSFEDLTASEVDLINTVISWIAPMSARQASEESHDALWEETPEAGEMSVAAGAVRIGEVDDEAMAWAMAEVDRLGLNQ